ERHGIEAESKAPVVQGEDVSEPHEAEVGAQSDDGFLVQAALPPMHHAGADLGIGARGEALDAVAQAARAAVAAPRHEPQEFVARPGARCARTGGPKVLDGVRPRARAADPRPKPRGPPLPSCDGVDLNLV